MTATVIVIVLFFAIGIGIAAVAISVLRRHVGGVPDEPSEPQRYEPPRTTACLRISVTTARRPTSGRYGRRSCPRLAEAEDPERTLYDETADQEVSAR